MKFNFKILFKLEENVAYLGKSFELKNYKPDSWKLYLEYKRKRKGRGKTPGEDDADDADDGNDDDDKKVQPLKEIKLVVYGDKGWSKEMRFSALSDHLDGRSRVAYQPGKTLYPSMGDFYKVRVGIPEEIAGPTKHDIGKIFLHNESQQTTFMFELNGRVEKNESNDGWKEAPVVPFVGNTAGNFETSHVEACLMGTCQVLSYGIQVKTGIAPESSTDDVIFVEIFGTRGSTGRRKLLENLSGNSKNFARGQLDVFLLEAVDLQRVERIHLGRMNLGNGGWMVDMVTVVVPNDDTVTNYKFNCSCWIPKEDPVKEFFLTGFEVTKDKNPT